jgi:hypothetical protein
MPTQQSFIFHPPTRREDGRDRTAGRPTDAQIKRLFTLATKAGLSYAQVKAEIKARFHKDSTKLLTSGQYDVYTDGLFLRACGATSHARLDNIPEDTLREVSAAVEAVSGDTALGRAPAPPAPDIEPFDGKFIGTKGAVAVAVAMVIKGRGGPLWPGMTADDVMLLQNLVDALRQCPRRGTFKRITMAQATRWVTKAATYPLPIFRRATQVFLDGYRHKDESYYFGILDGVTRDFQRAASMSASASA